jgi:hypothetical protein
LSQESEVIVGQHGRNSYIQKVSRQRATTIQNGSTAKPRLDDRTPARLALGRAEEKSPLNLTREVHRLAYGSRICGLPRIAT